jgi:hypothetical protein
MLMNISAEKTAKEGILNTNDENFWEKINTNLISLFAETNESFFLTQDNQVTF